MNHVHQTWGSHNTFGDRCVMFMFHSLSFLWCEYKQSRCSDSSSAYSESIIHHKEYGVIKALETNSKFKHQITATEQNYGHARRHSLPTINDRRIAFTITRAVMCAQPSVCAYMRVHACAYVRACTCASSSTCVL